MKLLRSNGGKLSLDVGSITASNEPAADFLGVRQRLSGRKLNDAPLRHRRFDTRADRESEEERNEDTEGRSHGIALPF